MTTWFSATFGPSGLDPQATFALINGLTAGSVLCALDGTVTVGQVPGVFGDTEPAISNDWGGAVGVVPHGSAFPEYAVNINEDIWIDRHAFGTGSFDSFWAPATDAVEIYNALRWMTHWRGARYYAASMDFWFSSGIEGPVALNHVVSGVVRLGFWD